MAAKKKKAAKKANVRTRMSEAQVDQFLKSWAKRHELVGKGLEVRLRHVAATRLAALDRYQKHQAA